MVTVDDRIFKAAVGEGPGQFVTRHRLERAAFELRSTENPVTEIAGRCGYKTPSAFSRAFAAKYGVSPSAFRAGASEVVIGTAVRRDEDVPECDVRYETQPARHVLSLRHVGPYDAVDPT
jgi:AraC family transcriptional regulator